MTSNLTRAERIIARHVLQEIMEQVRLLRNAAEPETGMLSVSRELLTEDLNKITARLEHLRNTLNVKH